MWVTERPFPVRSSSPTRALLRGIPEGRAGVIETLRTMRQLARDSVRSTDQTVRQLAMRLVRNLPERGWFREIAACHAFARDAIRYLHDPFEVELLQTPEKTLEYGQGDCDDKCILLAALLTSINHPANYVALGFAGGPEFEHVLVEARCGEKWIPCETIPWKDGTHKPTGWYPPGVARRYVVKV